MTKTWHNIQYQMKYPQGATCTVNTDETFAVILGGWYNTIEAPVKWNKNVTIFTEKEGLIRWFVKIKFDRNKNPVLVLH